MNKIVPERRYFAWNEFMGTSECLDMAGKVLQFLLVDDGHNA